jgi:hypothetical protein
MPFAAGAPTVDVAVAVLTPNFAVGELERMSVCKAGAMSQTAAPTLFNPPQSVALFRVTTAPVDAFVES